MFGYSVEFHFFGHRFVWLRNATQCYPKRMVTYGFLAIRRYVEGAIAEN
jgi:hypothetical protein